VIGSTSFPIQSRWTCINPASTPWRCSLEWRTLFPYVRFELLSVYGSFVRPSCVLICAPCCLLVTTTATTPPLPASLSFLLQPHNVSDMAKNKNLSIGSNGSFEELYASRQSQLYKDLEALLDLKPSTLNSSLLSLPRELHDEVFDFSLPEDIENRPELHTCLWRAKMTSGQAWDTTSSATGTQSQVPIGCNLTSYSSTSSSVNSCYRTTSGAAN
jgi:hypothetical protein